MMVGGTAILDGGQMRVSTVLAAFAAALLAIALTLAGVTLWSTERSRLAEQRIELAQASYSLHLSLQANIYQLLKQHADALLLGGADPGETETRLRARIVGDISGIRRVIGREIELVGEEEIEELELLADVEQRVATLTDSLSALAASGDTLDDTTRRARLADILDRQVDLELSGLIQSALEEEREEVVETMAEAAALRRSIRTTVGVVVFLSALIVAGFAAAFGRLVTVPLRRIMETAQEYREGRLEHRPAANGAREFAELGGVLGDMAASLAVRERSRHERQEELERKVAERTGELETLLRQFETSEANRRQLLADISHELRTPLAIIQGEAEVSLRAGDRPEAERTDSFARIRDAARHTGRIVDDLLTIARQEAGRLRLDIREVDLRVVVRDALAVFPHPVAVEGGAMPQRARVDAVRMRQCLLAALQNAQRYGGPRVTIRIETGPEAVALVVEDDGPGMSDVEKAQAFERFYRGPNAGRLSEEGTGLGLPIVRSIMDAHGGSVALEDVPGGGLRVKLRLPRRDRPRVVHDAGNDGETGNGNGGSTDRAGGRI